MFIKPLHSTIPVLSIAFLLLPALSSAGNHALSAAEGPAASIVSFDGTQRQLYAVGGNEIYISRPGTGDDPDRMTFATAVGGLTLAGSAGMGIVSLPESSQLAVFRPGSGDPFITLDLSGAKPGASIYEPETGTIFVSDSSKPGLIAVDRSESWEVSRYELAGIAGSMVGDQRGRVYGVLKGQPAIFIFNARTLEQEGSFRIRACSSATDIAIDHVERRLFVPCDNGFLFALDLETGLELARLEIPDGTASVALDFEPNRMLNMFISSSKGGLTIGRVEKVTFFVADSIPGAPPASSVAVDDDSGTGYLATGDGVVSVMRTDAGEK